MKKYVLLIVAVLFVSLVTAQQKKFSYKGNAEGGLVNGGYQTNAYISTSHGVTWNGWFVGLGAGIDYYRFRTIPVIAEFRKQLGKGDNRAFVVAGTGVDIAWPTGAQQMERITWWGETPSNFRNGFVCKAGAGVVFNAHRKTSFTINAAWNYKSITEKYSEFIWEPGPLPPAPTEKTAVYRLNRLSIGFGISF
ncbi:MAG: hypothetical protein K0Q66_115 [Chitinophagaceae bacterium]|jgi:hypothetical protein|nr:hypothetical protein [Chitinophagaceae bacterium]